MPTMAVKVLNRADLGRLPQDAPVVMLNLMRFRERSADGNGTGWDAYLRYSAVTVPMIKARGGTIIWAGHGDAVAFGNPAKDRWDYVALVYYPTRGAFLDMMTSPDYESICDPIREAACEQHVIIATSEAYSKMRAGG
jgi:uncharacterized protein (DUF1330 family)